MRQNEGNTAQENEWNNVTATPSKFPSVEDKMRECRLSWRQAEDEDDSIDQIPPRKKGPDKPPPPDKKSCSVFYS